MMNRAMVDNPNFTAKLIAAYIRNNIESFHGSHLNDSQMKELNPLIRNAVYTALLDISWQSGRVLIYAECYIPDYWEDCEYVEKL